MVAGREGGREGGRGGEMEGGREGKRALIVYVFVAYRIYCTRISHDLTGGRKTPSHVVVPPEALKGFPCKVRHSPGDQGVRDTLFGSRKRHMYLHRTHEVGIPPPS